MKIPDEVVREAARYLRSGAVPLESFVGALDAKARMRLRAHLLDCCARVGCAAMGAEWENGHRLCAEHAQEYRDRQATLRHHRIGS